MKTSTKVLHLAPRILCILTILFMSLFALDSFSAERTFWQNSAAFLMHLIPSFVLLAVLIVAWKWEKAGGIILTIIGLVWCIFVFILNFKRTHSVTTSLIIILTLGVPFVLAGILFIISHFRKKGELSGVR
jgi:hypothetical protein